MEKTNSVSGFETRMLCHKTNKCLLSSIIVIIFIIFFGQTIITSSAFKSLHYPVKPILINESDIGIGQKLDVSYWLEEGKKYHIFLVGDWVESNVSRTDYDITYFDTLSNLKRSHTEAAAMPEQIWNDGEGKYYLSDHTGAQTFSIWNDKEDGPERRSALLMAIEHIETDQVYTKYFKGRPSAGERYEYDTFFNPWSWEFETRAKEFEIYVDVPESLDMFELRLYPMAKPTEEIGYNLSGVGTPSGSVFGSPSGLYGGFNTENDGYRSFIASCEYPGQDMVIHYKEGDYTNETRLDDAPTFYYITMIAEYFEGEVEFYIKTDFTKPKVTDLNHVTVGKTDRATEFAVHVKSKTEVRQSYIEYSTDSWKTKSVAQMRLKDDKYVGTIPGYGLHTVVDYNIIIKDMVGNQGTIQGQYEVYDPVELILGVAPEDAFGGDKISIGGSCSLKNTQLQLEVSQGETTKMFNIESDADGRFTYEYTPTRDGTYTVDVIYAGDEDHYETHASIKTFKVTKRELDVTCSFDKMPAKLDQPLTVTGKVNPPVAGINLEFVFVSPTSNTILESCVTTATGSFSVSITPDELGYWQFLPQVKGTDLIMASTGGVVDFEVAPLTIVEQALLILMSMTEPPMIGVPIVLVMATVGGVVLKTGVLHKKQKESEEEEPEEEDEELQKKMEGLTSYKRRSERNKS